MAQSTIVYRNPIEQQLWEGTLLGGNGFPIAVAVVVFIIITMILLPVVEKVCKQLHVNYRIYGYLSYIPIIIGGIVAVGVARMMWI